MNLSDRGQTKNGRGLLVYGSYFPVLGIKPALGRLFTADDDATVGEPRIVVLSYDYWRRHLERRPGGPRRDARRERRGDDRRRRGAARV